MNSQRAHTARDEMDVFGQIRISTGQLDDLKAAYSQDGVHLTQAGVDAMAAIWKSALENYYA